MIRFLLRQSLLAITLVGFTGTVQGVDLFGYTLNTGQNPMGASNAGVVKWASRFTVGSTPVTINYIDYWAKGDSTLSPTIAIYTAKASGIGGGFEPDALVPNGSSTFLAGPSTINWNKVRADFAIDVTLAAGTSYYVVVDSSAANPPYLASSGQSIQFTAFGGTVATPLNRLIFNNGTSWASFSSASFVPYTFGYTPVPEPSAIALGVLATGMLGWIGRSNRRKRKN